MFKQAAKVSSEFEAARCIFISDVTVSGSYAGSFCCSESRKKKKIKKQEVEMTTNSANRFIHLHALKIVASQERYNQKGKN